MSHQRDEEAIISACTEALRTAKGHDKAEIYERMGDAYAALEKRTKAAVCYHEAMGVGPGRPELVDKYAGILIASAKLVDAETMLRNAIEGRTPDVMSARLHLKMAWIKREQGELEDSIKEAGLAQGIIDQLKEKDPDIVRTKAEVHNHLSQAYWREARLREAIAEIERALEFYKEVADEEGISTGTNSIGIIYYLLGEFDNALEYFKRANIGGHERFSYNNNQGIIANARGEYEKAERHLRASIRIGNVEGRKIMLHTSQLNMADIYIDQGQPVMAKTWANLAEKGFREMNNVSKIAEAMYTQGQISLLENKLPMAGRLLNQALEMAQKNKVKNLEIGIILQLGLLAKAKGDLVTAKRLITRAVVSFRDYDLKYRLGKALLQLGKVCKAAGSDEEARKAFDEARAVFTKIGLKNELDKMAKTEAAPGNETTA